MFPYFFLSPSICIKEIDSHIILVRKEVTLKMELISIGAVDNLDLIKNRLDREFNLLQEEGIKISLDEKASGEYNFLSCNILDYGNCGYSEEDTFSIFKHYVANAVSDVIVDDLEKNLLEEIVRHNYYYLTKEDQRTVVKYALEHLNDEYGLREEGLVYKIGRKSKVLQKVLEHLSGNNEIMLEGFVKFRLKEYLDELQQAIDRAVDDYLLDKEYREFIRLLKYFVEIQEPKMEKVNVIINPSGSFKLLDQENKPINSDYLEGFIIELSDNEINYEDLLISALITISPRQVVLHGQQDKKIVANTVGTIEDVFGPRVVKCKGCSTCQSLQN